MIGQDAVSTAQAFVDGVGYDAVVLTKLDGDARGGAALSIAELTGRPIMFASSGEKLEDFDLFHPDRMASRILDMGDMLTLIEQAERAFDEDQAADMAGKLVSGEGFTLEDFIDQLLMVRKLGPIGNLLGMLPGAAQNREMLSQIDDAQLDRVLAIVRSMTPDERRNPKIINGSRRARIAGGCGRQRQRGRGPGRPVLRGAEDDAPDARRRHAGCGCRVCQACGAKRSRTPAARRTRRSRRAGAPARPTVRHLQVAQVAGPRVAGLQVAAGLRASGKGFRTGCPGSAVLVLVRALLVLRCLAVSATWPRGCQALGKGAPSPADLPDLQDLPAAFKMRGAAKAKNQKRK